MNNKNNVILSTKGQSYKNGEYFPDIANSTVMGEYLTSKENDFIDMFLEKKKNLSVLDLGGGSGRFAIPLYTKGTNIIVLDYNSLPLSILRNTNNNIPCMRGDGQRLPFKPNTFEAILIMEVIEHVPDKDLLFKECFRVLRNDGILIMVLLNKFSYKIFHPNRKIRPNYYFATYRKFKINLGKHGFDVEKAFGFNWIPANRSSNNSLIPYFAILEKIFKLKHFPNISPWVIIKARK